MYDKVFEKMNTHQDLAQESMVFNPEQKETAKDLMAEMVFGGMFKGQINRCDKKVTTPIEKLWDKLGHDEIINKIKANPKFEEAAKNISGKSLSDFICNGEYHKIAYGMLNEAKELREQKFANVQKKEQAIKK